MNSFDPDLDYDAYHAEFERRARERRASRARRRRPQLGLRLPQREHHSHGDASSLRASAAGRTLISLVALMALATVIGLAVMWPHGHHNTGLQQVSLGHTIGVPVSKTSVSSCGGPSTGVSCRYVQISVHGQPNTIDLGPTSTAPVISKGTEISVSRVTGVAAEGAGAEQWQFVDIDRHGSLLWVAVALLVLAAAVLRWRGLLAALGVGMSLLLVVGFLVPAILDGSPALPAALVTALAVMFVTLIFTSGLGTQTLAAAVGIGTTLVLACLVALFAVHFVHLDGRTDELSAYLGTVNPSISLQGIVLAGMIIGALGVLADTAVTQASAATALRRADSTLTASGLYRAAFAVGRDHLSATIHTLVLAYAGASLPLLLITRATGVGLGDALNTQDIAEPVVAGLIGCIALVCAVPLTTGLAAMLLTRVPAQAMGDAHVHAH